MSSPTTSSPSSSSAYTPSLTRSALEARFRTLTPQILRSIDSPSLETKIQGMQLLRSVCENFSSTGSDDYNDDDDGESTILARTGLVNVFADALAAHFSYLPTLTPEEESLKLMRALYAAFRALVVARWPVRSGREGGGGGEVDGRKEVVNGGVGGSDGVGEGTTGTRTATATSNAVSSGSSSSSNRPITTSARTAKNSAPPPAFRSRSALTSTSQPSLRPSPFVLREPLLTRVIRHGILSSLNHLSAATDNHHPGLTTLLLHEASLLIPEMGIYASKHLSRLLPLLRHILSNPFGAASPPLLLAALECTEKLLLVCWIRVRDGGWWREILRGLVACWAVVDQEGGEEEVVVVVGGGAGSGVKKKGMRSEGTATAKQSEGVVDGGDLQQVKKSLQEVMSLVAGIVLMAPAAAGGQQTQAGGTPSRDNDNNKAEENEFQHVMQQLIQEDHHRLRGLFEGVVVSVVTHDGLLAGYETRSDL